MKDPLAGIKFNVRDKFPPYFGSIWNLAEPIVHDEYGVLDEAAGEQGRSPSGQDARPAADTEGK